MDLVFGGSGALSATAGEIDTLLQEFLHYFGKIWLRDHDAPQERRELEAFRIADVIRAFREHRDAGGTIPLEDGFDLVESYLVAQVVARRPLTCLVNDAMPDVPTDRMRRVVRLDPDTLVEQVQRRCVIELGTSRAITDQLQRWSDLMTPLVTLVYEEELMGGHCILILGHERKSDRLIYWDPWPLRSLLCAENNKADVDAHLVGGDDEYFWALPLSSMAKVLYAVFVPA